MNTLQRRSHFVFEKDGVDELLVSKVPLANDLMIHYNIYFWTENVPLVNIFYPKKKKKKH